MPGDRGRRRLVGVRRRTRTPRRTSCYRDYAYPREGQWVARIWLRDAAGNEDRRTAQAVPLNLDDTPPSVAFAAIDETDPTRIDVHASDATSPLVRTEIEARRRGDGAWITLPTTATSTGFSSRLDDEVLPNGEYSLRARATDSAGNERSTDRELSGKVALRDVPMRVDTRLVAGQIKTVKGRRTRGGRRRTRRVIVARPKIPFGGTIPIRGRLTMPGGNAVANAGIEVWERRMDTRRCVSTRSGDRDRRLRPLYLQSAPRTEPYAPVPLSRYRDCPSAYHRGRHTREGRVQHQRQPPPRRKRRRHRSPRSDTRWPAALSWQASPATGILAR